MAPLFDSTGLSTLEHDVNAGELNQLQRSVLDERATQYANPELLVRLDIGHGEMHVAHPQPDLIRLDQLRKRGSGAQER